MTQTINKGTLAKINIVDAKTGEIVQKNVMMQVEECKTIEQINKELAMFFLPRRFELVEWIK
tara:strand:+ start:669 stop:854 length:186 start_codon:yes stop_codon:yes gene_type:complete